MKIHYNLGVITNYAPRERDSGRFCGRILALGRWNWQMY